jgi:hypothetical protein
MQKGSYHVTCTVTIVLPTDIQQSAVLDRMHYSELKLLYSTKQSRTIVIPISDDPY